MKTILSLTTLFALTIAPSFAVTFPSTYTDATAATGAAGATGAGASGGGGAAFGFSAAMALFGMLVPKSITGSFLSGVTTFLLFVLMDQVFLLTVVRIVMIPKGSQLLAGG